MYKSATKCNETVGKWCKNKHGASKIIDTLETYQGASSEVDRGGLTHRGRGQGLGRAALLCGRLVAPLRLLFGPLEASVNFWMFGFCFVQFREYFLCNFSETQK
jgi:hypothetical protein